MNDWERLMLEIWNIVKYENELKGSNFFFGERRSRMFFFF